MKGRIIKAILSLVIVSSFAVVAIMVTLIVQNYTDTKQWNVTRPNEEIHNTPPQLAKNYVSMEDRQLLELLSGVNRALSEIEMNEGIDPDHLDSYRHLYENASKLQDELQLEDSELTEPIQTLGLYLNIEQAIQSAYTKPNPERFMELTDKLSDRLLNDSQEQMDTIYLDKLSKIANQYEALDAFITHAIGLIGSSENGKLTVSPTITKELTDDLVNRITENDLEAFTHIERLKTLLTSAEWEEIIQHADAKRKRDAWLEAKESLESLSKSDYISASHFQTYEDVVNFGYQAYVEHRPGYEVDMKSNVTAITVNGQRVPDDAYFKKHANVQFTIDTEYIYTKQEPDDIPKPDFDIEYDNWYDSDTTAEEEGLLDESEPNNDQPF